ncbi:MAG TPA: ABC transporter substrate-binding protein [Chloroflexota bacterium]|nr:ABC transporter substrate-binding protein [Chloroflexota bacterium]
MTPETTGKRAAARLTRAIALILLVALPSSVLRTSGSARAQGRAADTPVRGGILTQGFQNDLATLDPAIGYDWNNWPAEKMVFDGLLDYNQGTTLEPRLAASMPTVSKDGRTYTFTLRKGVLFQNGRELTSADVAYSINRVLDPKTKSPGSSFFLSIAGAQAMANGKAATASGIKVLSRYVIQFTLTQPDTTFLNVLAMNFAYIVPKEVVAKEGANFGHAPVGTGPFLLKQWIAGQKLVFVRNPHYFYEGLPYLDGVTFLIGLAPEVALLRLESGQLDMLADPIPAADFVSIKNNPKYAGDLVRYVQPETTYLTMNTQIAPFNNVKVRQAVNMAIDKTRVVQLSAGRGVVADQILPPLMPGYDPSYKGYAHDPAAAKKLLAQAGYPNGFSTQLYVLNVDPQPRIAESFQSDLAQIGIKVSIVPLASATLVDQAGTPKKAAMVWSGGEAWLQDFPDPSDFYGPILGCDSAVQGGWNWPFFCDKKLDAMAAHLKVMPDSAARYAGYKTLYSDVMAQAPWVPVINNVAYVMHSPQIHGNATDFTHNVHTFFYERLWKH